MQQQTYLIKQEWKPVSESLKMDEVVKFEDFSGVRSGSRFKRKYRQVEGIMGKRQASISAIWVKEKDGENWNFLSP